MYFRLKHWSTSDSFLFCQRQCYTATQQLTAVVNAFRFVIKSNFTLCWHFILVLGTSSQYYAAIGYQLRYFILACKRWSRERAMKYVFFSCVTHSKLKIKLRSHQIFAPGSKKGENQPKHTKFAHKFQWIHFCKCTCIYISYEQAQAQAQARIANACGAKRKLNENKKSKLQKNKSRNNEVNDSQWRQNTLGSLHSPTCKNKYNVNIFVAAQLCSSARYRTRMKK